MTADVIDIRDATIAELTEALRRYQAAAGPDRTFAAAFVRQAANKAINVEAITPEDLLTIIGRHG